MEQLLPVVFMAVMGLALFMYVVLDGFDLGIGMLLPFASNAHKDVMVDAIGPFWDANETWIVLGIGVLLIAFPKAHGMILTALYLPVTIMLFGLIIRGIAFDFRVKAGDHRKALWNWLFFFGSLVASVSQGWMLGAYITGLENSATSTVFSLLVAVTLPSAYVLLGAGWLLIKTEGELFDIAIGWAKLALIPAGIALLLVSIATPIASSVIAQKWFVLPNFIGLLPIPLTSVLVFGLMIMFLWRPALIRRAHWVVFAGVCYLCVMAALGLAYSLFPDIVVNKMTLWDAHAATESLLFVLVGVVLTVPMILGYTVYVYRVFSGKSEGLRYD